MSKTATEKFDQEYQEIVRVLERGFSDMKAGDKMLISSPKSIATYIHRIRYGEQKTIKQMRHELALDSHADNTCPLMTGIFLRVAIEASLESCQSNKGNILPFWRLFDEKHPLVKKLGIDSNFIQTKRKDENLVPPSQ
jgi:hypothetical protein